MSEPTSVHQKGVDDKKSDPAKLIDEETQRLLAKWRKEYAIQQAELDKRRMSNGDARCIRCRRWRSDVGIIPCYSGLRCNCKGTARCGDCLDPNHVY